MTIEQLIIILLIAICIIAVWVQIRCLVKYKDEDMATKNSRYVIGMIAIIFIVGLNIILFCM